MEASSGSAQRDPFARTTLPTHVTASALVLDPSRGLVLLHLHRRIGRWLQPGGHVEPGERPEDAALRETLEETAVAARHPEGSPSIVHLDEHPGPDGHVHLDLRYLLLADAAAPPVGHGERTGDGPGPMLRWVPPDEVSVHADVSLVRAVTALQQRAGRRPIS
jgi:8-oxo-dGTP pyrophosphatase MutT (NUDIX family)